MSRPADAELYLRGNETLLPQIDLGRFLEYVPRKETRDE